ncbi:hypothetical protein WG915_09575 [Corynebacterium sp. H128]|uniref:hypothetical protein n=1 Tax=unclassified Corynebacterium TaxID=2624378 RepID=UPI003094E89E
MAKNTITDALGSDSAALEDNAGVTGRMLIGGLDNAVRLQTSVVENYVKWLRSNNPNATPAQIQADMDKHFKRLATGSGGAAGLAAAFPGVGFITGAAAVGAESLVFLNAAALYSTASALLRGVEVRDAERRRALILAVVLGAPGTAVVDALLGDVKNKELQNASVANKINRISMPGLNTINTQLMKMVRNRFAKRLRTMWIGKIMPLGIGLVVGTIANRKLADQVIQNTRESMGPIPAQFTEPLPMQPAPEQGILAKINPRKWSLPKFGK